MKTIIRNSGEVLYATLVEVELNNDEIVIDEQLTTFYIKPYFNFDTRVFYEGATQQEIDYYSETI